MVLMFNIIVLFVLGIMCIILSFANIDEEGNSDKTTFSFGFAFVISGIILYILSFINLI